MRRIRVKNFGPIREGFGDQDGWMDIRKVTFFIGDNGAGKSTIAKLIATLSWLEKALFRGQLSEKELYRKKTLERYTRYHKIESFFSQEPATEIDYEGDAFAFSYRAERLYATRKQTKAAQYLVPKIMYVGSERSFLSVATRAYSINGLPASLGTFLDEFRDGLAKIPDRLPLPVGNVSLSYNKQNGVAYVHGSNESYRIRLTDASSGIQASTPLFVVSRYLSLSLVEEKDRFTRERSSEEEKKFRDEIARIINDRKLPEDVKTTMLQMVSGRYHTARFQNIVEEPEMNLFPDSQRMVLYKLLEFANATPQNELLVTTHSPYLISYLSLAIKAAKVIGQIHNSESREVQTIQLEAIVPVVSTIQPESVIIYEIKSDGIVEELETEGGIPADENDLNEKLMEINEQFSELINLRHADRLG